MRVNKKPLDKALDPEEGTDWRLIPGYFYQYRINELGQIEKLLDSGKWYRLKPFIKRDRYHTNGKLQMRMRLENGRYSNISVKNLMIDTFLGGRKPGVVYGLRNGSTTDCSVYNIYPSTLHDVLKRTGGINRRAVEKVDRDGNVLELYASVSEAADKNYIARKSILARCKNRMKDPYINGYTFRYEDDGRSKRTY